MSQLSEYPNYTGARRSCFFLLHWITSNFVPLCRNPLKFKSIECNLLLETVRGEDNSTGGENNSTGGENNSTGGENTREDRGSQTEEEELS